MRSAVDPLIYRLHEIAQVYSSRVSTSGLLQDHLSLASASNGAMGAKPLR